jgi:hypothetical protein
LNEEINKQRALAERKVWYLSCFLLLASFILFIMFGMFSLHTPDVSYESSDGKYSDSELHFKGRGFEAIISGFERYKEECGVNKVSLFRVTEKNYWNVFAWPNYLAHSKWLTPYREPTSGVKYTGVISC